MTFDSGHLRPGEGRRAVFGSSHLLGDVWQEWPFDVQGTRRNVGFSRVKALRERTDVWRSESLNKNGLQQSQVLVLERLESGRPVLRA